MAPTAIFIMVGKEVENLDREPSSGGGGGGEDASGAGDGEDEGGKTG